MMNFKSICNACAVVSISFALAACGGGSVDEEEVARIAEKFKIKKTEQAAYRACIDASVGTSPYVKIGIRTWLVDDFPIEVCGCQAKTIASIFKSETVSSYSTFVKWSLKPERKSSPRIKKSELAKAESTKLVTEKLLKSLDGCAAQYFGANKEIAAKLLKPYVDPVVAKKAAEAKKKKEDEAKAKEEAAKKS